MSTELLKNIFILLFSVSIFISILLIIINYLKQKTIKNLKFNIFLVKIPQYSDKEKALIKP